MFKFLSLGLLFATIGLYNSVNAVETDNNVGNNSNVLTLKEKYLAFSKELWSQTKNKNLTDISTEYKIPLDVVKAVYTSKAVEMAKKAYQDTPAPNRNLHAVTEKFNVLFGHKHTERFVARLLKPLGYTFDDYKETVSNEIKHNNDVSDKEIVDYINQPGYTVTDAVEYFKQFGKSAKEIREIYANSNKDSRLVYEVASVLDNNGELYVNGAVDSVINVIRSSYGKNIDRELVKEICEKLDFIPIMDDDLGDY